MGDLLSAKNIIGIVLSAALGTVTIFVVTKACKWAWPRIEKGWSLWLKMLPLFALGAATFLHMIWRGVVPGALTSVDLYIIYMIVTGWLFFVLVLLTRMDRVQERHIGVTSDLASNVKDIVGIGKRLTNESATDGTGDP